MVRSGSPNHVSHGRDDKWDTQGVLLPESAARTPMEFPALFGNTRPVEIEIGTGKGTFLLARAQARPDLNFVGVEWARSYCLYAADRFRRHGLANVRMIRADAATLFRHAVPDASLLRVHVYFPDPWPKRRHHSRRLIQTAFVRTAWDKLIAGGQLLVVTDHRDYFTHIRRVLDAAPNWAHIGFPTMADGRGEVVGTNFERKYIAQGRSFHSIARMKYLPSHW